MEAALFFRTTEPVRLLLRATVHSLSLRQSTSGAIYDVKVLTQPTSPPQTCTVANGRGTASATNVTNITVTRTATPRYTVGVAVSGPHGHWARASEQFCG